MTYHDIIERNEKIIGVSWWAKYAFHYTDVSNAVSILSSGKLYSRIKAEHSHLMQNDNASSQVIDMTGGGVKSYVRFYFRPLTPTQYYNEGYKHPDLRYCNDINANIPVPVFFVFNLDKLLQSGKVQFSNFSQAGSGAQVFSGIENFEKLNFKKIYSYGYTEDDAERKCRHAELLYPDEYIIDDSLMYILCRNDVEKQTLLNLLFKNNRESYYKYKEKIKIGKQKTFENNGLFVKSIMLNNNYLYVFFADSYYKNKYDENMLKKNDIKKGLKPIKAIVALRWENQKYVIDEKYFEVEINYQNPGKIVLKLPEIKRASRMVICVKIENNVIAYIKHDLDESEIV